MDNMDAVVKAVKGSLLEKVVERALLKLEKYYNRSSELLTVATTVDPTMKTGWCEYKHIAKGKVMVLDEEEEEGEKDEGEVEEEEEEDEESEGEEDEKEEDEEDEPVDEPFKEASGTLSNPSYDKYTMRSEFLRIFQGYSHIVRVLKKEKAGVQASKVPRLDYMVEARKTIAASCEQKTQDTEAMEYLISPVVTTEEEEDLHILRWWKAQAYVQPAVAAMAKDFLAIQATSASSERAFSIARRVVTEFRGSLAPRTIRALLCLKTWLKDEDEAKAADFLDYDSDGEASDLRGSKGGRVKESDAEKEDTEEEEVEGEQEEDDEGEEESEDEEEEG